MTDIVERLKITEADGRHLPLHELRQEAANEIERLRYDLGLERHSNERLRGQLQRATSMPTASEAARNVALEAEIERLRVSEATALKALANTDENCRARFAEYRAEIEQLRGDLAAMSDSVAVAAQALNDEERENERLCELLREALDRASLDRMDGLLRSDVENWAERVREALGE